MQKKMSCECCRRHDVDDDLLMCGWCGRVPWCSLCRCKERWLEEMVRDMRSEQLTRTAAALVKAANV